jgi:hypothetical protein
MTIIRYNTICTWVEFINYTIKNAMKVYRFKVAGRIVAVEAPDMATALRILAAAYPEACAEPLDINHDENN